MPITIESVRLMRDGFTAEMDWGTDVIGLSVRRINVQIAASGAPTASMPSTIRVQVTSRTPNKDWGNGTIPRSSPLAWNVPRFGPDRAQAKVTLYRLDKAITDAGDFLAPDGTQEVTTVVRPGGTSDADFRRTLGWVSRGIGTQPTISGARTANKATDTPDGLRLLQCGGAEVLEVAAVAAKGWKVLDGRSWCLVRSPADIAYYSGHGLHRQACLGIEAPPGSHNYLCWARASDLTPHWRHPMDLDVFIVAGCSVLHIDSTTSPPSGPGLNWAELLTTKGGPLTALLGYAESAPADAGAATPIARDMAARLSGGSRNFVKDWLEVNAAHKAWNAVGLDEQGYWWLEVQRKLGFLWSTGFAIRGPESIP